MTPSEWIASLRGSFGVTADVDDRARLLEHCEIQGECWVWVGRKSPGIGGAMRIGRSKPIAVQRLAYAMMVGRVPRKARVGSSCGDASCCMPAHLVVSGEAAHMPLLCNEKINEA